MKISPRLWIYICSTLALAAFCPRGSVAQEQAPVSSTGVIQINVGLVQVDAVVTDSKGKPVTELKADDFELLQDGKVQKIRNFSFINVAESSVPIPSTVSRSPNPGASTLLPPAAPLRRDEIRRTVALVVDDIALSNDGVVHVREALRKWVEKSMQPGDLVSVVRTNAATGSLQQFTNDKRILSAAIDRLTYQPGRVGVESFAPIQRASTVAGPVDTGFAGDLANAYLLESLNAVRYIMQGLHGLPGRKSLVLFSEDLSLTNLDTQRQSIEERMRRLTDEANRSSVVIYTIDPRALSIPASAPRIIWQVTNPRISSPKLMAVSISSTRLRMG